MREIKFRAWDGQAMKYDFWCASHGEHNFFAISSVVKSFGFDWPLMQYTGLKDKNGVEIYEGDIIKAGLVLQGCDNPYVVKWDEEEATFLVQNKSYCEDDVEVIGNIYENPELLEEEKE